MFHSIVLCGGSGSRLWPLSTEKYPKQFINLFGNKSLLQNTIDRIRGIGCIDETMEEHITLVSNSNFIPIIEEQCPNSRILCEKYKRDTAGAICASVCMCNDDDLILIVPADHYIPNNELFKQTIRKGINQAKNGHIVTYGVKPTYAETGYGYIESGKNITKDVLHVQRFREKPNKETAEFFISQGNYYWNSGIFLFTCKTFKEEMRKYSPDILSMSTKSIKQLFNNNQRIYELNDFFKDIPKISIDYALMEKSDKVVVVPSHFEWSDVGSWKSVHSISSTDCLNNTLNNNIYNNTENCYSSTLKKTVIIGLNNVAVVETSDAILVFNMDKSSKLKETYNQMNQC